MRLFSEIIFEMFNSVWLWHPFLSQIYLYLLNGFLSKFSCCFPWAICPHAVWSFTNMFSFINTGPYGSKISNKKKNATPTNHRQNFSNLSRIFFPIVLTKFLGHEILRLWFLPICVSIITKSQWYPLEKPESSIIWKTIDHRAQRSKIWDSLVLGVSLYDILLTL